jgi:DNA-binding PadR family transcriptional regulator
MSTHVGVFELLVLLAVHSHGDEAYGVTIRRAVAASRGRDVSSGAVSTTLERLEARGLVVSRQGDAAAARSGRPRRYFRVTRAGEAIMNEHVAALRQMTRQARARLSRS